MSKATDMKRFIAGLFHPRNMRTTSPNKGMVLPTLLILFLVLMVVGLSLATRAITHMSTASRSVAISNSLFAAETGGEMTLHELNRDNSFAGFSETVFYDRQPQGKATYETTVADGSISNEKIITSIGRLYRKSDSPEPVATRRIRLVVVGTTSGDYVVQTGPGGLIMSNTATVANGEIHVNGYITMSNTSQIGTEATPTIVEAAHINCPDPPDSTYPSLCDSGEPIDMQDKSHIYGDVYATNQTDGSQMSDTGLIDGSTADEVALPDYDRQTHKDNVSNTISSDWSCAQSDNKTWSADLKIEGNVTIKGQCEVTLEGDVWITGDVEMRNSSTVIVSDNVTETPTVMIDGSNGFAIRNSAAVITNGDGIGTDFITFYALATCSPDCTDLSGSDLYDSQSHTTIKIRNSSLAAGSTFYSRWTRVEVDNSGSIGSVLGQTIKLTNTGVISIGENLSSGDKIWTIKNYQQIYK